MISLLARLFIKPDPAREEPETRRAYGVLCGIVGICLNVLLFAGKFLAGTLSGSIAITADAFNNLSDAGSSFVTLVGFQLAGQKPDSEHPFGHGRMEYVSGLAVSVLILLMGLELGKTSIEKILHPEPVDSSPLIFAILCASILVKLYMFLYNRRLGKKLASPAMEATAMDSLSDSVATAAVLIATLVGRFTGLEIDGWCGVLVAAFILWSGINAVRDTLDPLLGTPPTHEFVQRIRDLVMAHSTILGIHDLIVHDYGPGRVMISLHAEVPANEDVLALHDEIDNVEKELREKLGCDAVIHMDPVVTDDGVRGDPAAGPDPGPLHRRHPRHPRLPHGVGAHPHEPDLRRGGALRLPPHGPGGGAENPQRRAGAGRQLLRRGERGAVLYVRESRAAGA